MKSGHLQYLVITPARNEEAFLELTIQSMVSQTVRPFRWLIVSDGSTDRTDEIVARYAAQHNWIELFRMPERKTRDFGGKARCFNTGYRHIKDRPHDVLVSLDADITFVPGYFEFLLDKLTQDSRLGVAGTPFSEEGMTYDYRFSSSDHVSGACQVFRRECFEVIGGYVESKGGGIDVIAVLTARMKGWRTHTFVELTCEHHRPMGSANHRHKLMMNYKLGQRQYCLGFHPLWQLFRSTYQMTRKPYVTAGAALGAGYFWSMLRRIPRPIGPELVAFQRRDQMRRLRKFLHLGSPETLQANMPSPAGPAEKPLARSVAPKESIQSVSK
jgi:glycosyltransferase involved in cell wall biosynthesis